MAVDGCRCCWRRCCLTSDKIYAAKKLQHPSGYREPCGIVVHCDPIKVQAISTVKIAVVGKPVHPSAKADRNFASKSSLEEKGEWVKPVGKYCGLLISPRKINCTWPTRSISHFCEQKLWPDAVFMSSVRWTQSSALLSSYLKKSKDRAASEVSHQAIRIRVCGKDPKES